jgi:hypothetical protein
VDHPVRSGIEIRRQSPSVSIHPNARQSEPLGSRDLPLEIVPHHPGLGGGHPQAAEGLPVDTGIGLPEAELALDEHDVEEAGQTEALDLVPLVEGIPVRDKASPKSSWRSQSTVSTAPSNGRMAARRSSP